MNREYTGKNTSVHSRNYKRRNDLDNKFSPRYFFKTLNFRRILEKKRRVFRFGLPSLHCPTHLKKAGSILCIVSAAFTIRLMIAWGNNSIFDIVCMVLVGCVFEYCKVVFMPSGIHFLRQKIYGWAATLIISAALLVCFSIVASIGFARHATDSAAEIAQHESFEYKQVQQAIITTNGSIKSAQTACESNSLTNANIVNSAIQEKEKLIDNHFYKQSRSIKIKTLRDGCDRIQQLQTERDKLMATLSVTGKDSAVTAMSSASSAIAETFNFKDANIVSNRGQLFICAMIEALSIICLSVSGFRMDFSMLMALINNNKNDSPPPLKKRRRGVNKLNAAISFAIHTPHLEQAAATLSGVASFPLHKTPLQDAPRPLLSSPKKNSLRVVYSDGREAHVERVKKGIAKTKKTIVGREILSYEDAVKMVLRKPSAKWSKTMLKNNGLGWDKASQYYEKMIADGILNRDDCFNVYKTHSSRVG